MRIGIPGSRLPVDCVSKFREGSAKLWYLEGPQTESCEIAGQLPTSLVAPGAMS